MGLEPVMNDRLTLLLSSILQNKNTLLNSYVILDLLGVGTVDISSFVEYVKT